jgi:hypothetical protein
MTAQTYALEIDIQSWRKCAPRNSLCSIHPVYCTPDLLCGTDDLCFHVRHARFEDMDLGDERMCGRCLEAGMTQVGSSLFRFTEKKHS